MTKEQTVFTSDQEKEQILLVIVEMRKAKTDWRPIDVLNETQELVHTSGGEVVDHLILRNVEPSPKYLIGEGQLREIEEMTKSKKIDTVIFSYDLKGRQLRNIEEVLKVRTIDRTQLILDIFARHAVSNEGKLQVELAQLTYLLPRLVGQGVVMSRLGGGIGTVGPGETKLEMDRRRITEKIDRLKKNLDEVVLSRDTKRKQRKDRGIPSIALVGYTNAGKSTLLNALTDAEQITHDGLFTTLDALSRHFILPNHQKIILSDTVGFIHELPHHLIESFKATLEEVHEADVLLHVVDVSDDHFRLRHDVVVDVLAQMGITDKPVITVLNKIDKLQDRSSLKEWECRFERAVSVSMLTKENVEGLVGLMMEMVSEFVIEIDVTVPIARMDLVSLAHEQGEVIAIKYENDTINIRACVPRQIAGKFVIRR